MEDGLQKGPSELQAELEALRSDNEALCQEVVSLCHELARASGNKEREIPILPDPSQDPPLISVIPFTCMTILSSSQTRMLLTPYEINDG